MDIQQQRREDAVIARDSSLKTLSKQLLTTESMLNTTREKHFNCSSPDVVFQELPNHISLAFTIHGCPFECPGCHSEHTWDGNTGSPLSDQAFVAYLDQYQGLISAVVFLGGEWHAAALARKLRLAKQRGLITCLYSGGNHISKQLKPWLDFVKLGPWQEALGGLDSPTTNQRFIELREGEFWQDQTHWFRKDTPSTPSPYSLNHAQGVSYASA
jgi:anaerobic ribonucleoside-triphosphate reductase activating protein